MQLGRFEMTVVPDAPFRLDGGAMFGAVPRVLWERVKPADERHRIAMATNCLLIRSADEVVLVDTGLGDKLDAKSRALHAIPDGIPRLPDRLRSAGCELDDVTHVVLSHLHFDHCGWNTREEGGLLLPTFPRARYWLQRDEVEHARSPDPRSAPSYDPRNFEPLFEAGVVELFDDEATPSPGIKAVRAPGHTRGMCVVTVDGGGEGCGAVFFADLVPTAAHLPVPWVMGFDLYPVTTMEQKRDWLRRAAAGDWLCVFEHDPEVPLARLRPDDRPGRYRAEAVTTGTGADRLAPVVAGVDPAHGGN
ncbi:MAG TPA: MBL fold metallo-hydrolase [Thermoanaerobaculia bacterium]|nr:MBL fold metallo-hydrolase [Thermoanaerobaculia bacterium]